MPLGRKCFFRGGIEDIRYCLVFYSATTFHKLLELTLILNAKGLSAIASKLPVLRASRRDCERFTIVTLKLRDEAIAPAHC